METAQVDVIVPTYNVVHFVGECLDSVRLQTQRGWHCLVVDDGSTDETVERVRKYKDQRVALLTQANAGVSAARNTGLAAATAPYVLFLDADDLLHPTALERLVTALDTASEAVAAFGTFVKLLENGEHYPQQKPLHLHRYPSGDVLEPMLRENFLANGGHVLVRREVAQRIGGFDPTLRLSEDWEFWCRLALQGPFVFIGCESEVFYLRVRAGSSSPQLSEQLDNHAATLARIVGNPAIRARFAPRHWRRLVRQMEASQCWEAGRVNFTRRRFGAARKLMMRSLVADPQLKRLALFALAQLSQVLDRPLASRLRFADQDAARERK